MAGFSATKADIDGRVGRIALQLRDTLTDATRANTWLLAKTDADLTALGYTAAEITVLRASMADLAKLARIANGNIALAVATDFFASAGQLLGAN